MTPGVWRLWRLGPALVLAAACTSRPVSPTAATTSPSEAGSSSEVTSARVPQVRAEPPPPGPWLAVSFPEVVGSELENGLRLRVVERSGLPIVELTLVILSGASSDAGQPGLAMIAGELLKDGGAGSWSSRQLLDLVESLGASLEIWTGPDATRLTLGVTTQHLEAAFDILAAVALRPRFAPEEFRKLKAREIERVQNLARTSGRWAARMALFRRLYSLPTDRHPYAAYDATPSELAGVSLRSCRGWHKKHVTPENTVLVATGAVSPDMVLSNARRVFAGWRGGPPERPAFANPLPPARLEVRVVDRPGSTQSDILIGLLGAPRISSDWLPLKTATQILGGSTAGRLFLDVREKRSLAYSTGAGISERAQGPVPILLWAGTRTEMTARAVDALLEHLDRLGREAPLDTEVQRATRYLADSLLVRLETVESVTDLATDVVVLQLAEDYYEDYRESLRTLDVSTLYSVARRYFSSDRAHVVVTGDADTIAGDLARFAEVKVVDPEHDFIVKRTIDRDPTSHNRGASP